MGMSEGGKSGNKLAIIEERLQELYSSVATLEDLSNRIRDGKKSTEKAKVGSTTIIRCLCLILNELPDQLLDLTERIRKTTDEISASIY